MDIQHIDLEAENKEIAKRYRALLKSCKHTLQKGDKATIRKAFNMAVEAHSHMRRKSGEPYIYHPIAVAQIVAEEIGLGTTGIVCALLHDVVEDTDITLDDLKREYGKTVASIVDGLTKISGEFDPTTSMQAENFRKMLLTLADDVRVILIKLADRLHNMRTLDHMARHKQLKIASETSFLYAPLAHRLGLYSIKSELEDLSMKFTEQATYKFIEDRLQETQTQRNKFINDFVQPIKAELTKQNIDFQVYGRTKSIFSIWNKMRKKNIPFEEVYDIFAIRVLLNTPLEMEKSECWKVYSIVTDNYTPNPDRLRDWISIPRANGYESLHTTVMGNNGRWVEVQIRTQRMNEMAEKGFAAHWKYKEGSADNHLDNWLARIRELLSHSESTSIDFVEDFKMNLYAEEVFIFTPKGELRKLPSGATALDFAFDIHSNVGAQCIGAKVNHKLVPISHVLQNGDQVEVLTSAKQSPKEDWLNIVVTSKAKTRVKQSLNEEKRKIAEDGKEILERKMRGLKMAYEPQIINKMALFFGLPSGLELHYLVAKGTIDSKDIKAFVEAEKHPVAITTHRTVAINDIPKPKAKDDTLLLGDELQKIDYTLSQCCNPIPGDDVFGFTTVSEGIKIHRTSCPNATQLMANFGYRILKARWTQHQAIAFLTGVKITGIDTVGLINNITKVISNDFKVNMRSISVGSNDGVFEGNINVYVYDTTHLDELMDNLKAVSGVHEVYRYEVQE